MSLFLQYQFGQALGDLGGAGGAGGDPSAAAGGAGTGFGFALGFLMPGLIARSMQGRAWPRPPLAPAPWTGLHRYCGQCGAGLVPGGRFCGHCGTARG